MEVARVTSRISAVSRYWLYLNGEYLGTGPVRSWPDHWKYDAYDLTEFLGSGANVLAVLVPHYGEGNFQYIPAPAGLWAELAVSERKGDERILLGCDSGWKTATSPSHLSPVPRISVQQGFEEQFDARLEDGWKDDDYDDSGWDSAIPVLAPHEVWELSGIPLLTRDPVFPQRILRAEVIRPASMSWTLQVKPY